MSNLQLREGIKNQAANPCIVINLLCHPFLITLDLRGFMKSLNPTSHKVIIFRINCKMKGRIIIRIVLVKFQMKRLIKLPNITKILTSPTPISIIASPQE